MNTLQKLHILGSSAAYDRCGCEYSRRDFGRKKRIVPTDGIYPASALDGRRTMLLKVLQSNECLNDCRYCVNRCGRDLSRASFEPHELADLFYKYLREGYIEGLFLSSGVHDSGDSMDEIIETVSLVRRMGFRGYIHTKILPGASRDQVKYAAGLSTRLSVNIEAPSSGRLSELSSQKDFRCDILRRMRWIRDEVRGGRVYGGQTTQFIVGAAGESDYEILKMTGWLYDEMDLRRTYFSAFSPVSDTPLSGHPRTPGVREYRLYQADFLLRDYGFRFRDLVFNEDGGMPYNLDPKLAYALKNRGVYPVDVGEAGTRELMLVPGIGLKTAQRIVAARDSNLHMRSLIPRKALPFLEVDGLRQLRISDCF